MISTMDTDTAERLLYLDAANSEQLWQHPYHTPSNVLKQAADHVTLQTYLLVQWKALEVFASSVEYQMAGCAILL